MALLSGGLSNFIIIALFICQQVIAGSYQLDTQYSGSSFFDGFTFFDVPDYTHGFVNYVNRATAAQNGLISTAANGSVYMGVDSTTVLNPNSGPGRNSVRITSNKSWTHGLVLLDLAHMPGTDCGSWPAFWMVGPDWPAGGEIDIIEGVNSNTLNQVSLHTNDNCTITNQPATELGTLINPNCAESQSTGCAVLASTPSTYGTPFNALSGGIYATEWTSSYIRIYYFPRNAIPADITSENPNPANWGLPQANMMGNCDIDKHFYSHQIVFDTTFCGDWAGSVWQWDSVCSVKAVDCQTYVAGNPGAFTNAYWIVNSLKVYTSVPSPSSTSKMPAASTSVSKSTTLSSTSKVGAASTSTSILVSSTSKSSFGSAPTSSSVPKSLSSSTSKQSSLSSTSVKPSSGTSKLKSTSTLVHFSLTSSSKLTSLSVISSTKRPVLSPSFPSSKTFSAYPSLQTSSSTTKPTTKVAAALSNSSQISSLSAQPSPKPTSSVTSTSFRASSTSATSLRSSSTFLLPQFFFKRDVSSVVPARSAGGVVGSISSSSSLSGGNSASTSAVGGSLSSSEAPSTVVHGATSSSTIIPTTSVKSGGVRLGGLGWIVSLGVWAFVMM